MVLADIGYWVNQWWSPIAACGVALLIGPMVGIPIFLFVNRRMINKDHD